MSDLTYNGSSGWSGTDTSRERAESQDGDGTTGQVQRLVLRFVAFSGSRGETIAELRRILPHLHHGSLSSALTNLHRAGKIARLSEKRGRCKVYVHPQHVDGRETEPPRGRAPSVAGMPTAEVYRSEDGRWVVHVDTTVETGHLTVYINDGDAVFDQDPETEPPTRRQKVESRAVYTLLPEDFEDRAGRPLTETELRYAVKGVETVVGDALGAIVEAVLDD